MQLCVSEVAFSSRLARTRGEFISDCSRGTAGVGSSWLFWEALVCMEEAEDLGDTSHSQSCREVAALYEKDSEKFIRQHKRQMWKWSSIERKKEKKNPIHRSSSFNLS